MPESLLVGTLLSYLVSLAAGMRQEAISEALKSGAPVPGTGRGT